MLAPLPLHHFNDAAEATDFTYEFAAVTAAGLGNGKPELMLVIHRRLQAELSPFALLLRTRQKGSDRTPLLAPWLQQWAVWNCHDDLLFDTLLYLDGRGLEPELLRQLSLVPTIFIHPEQMKMLRDAPLGAVRQWVDFQRQAARDKLTHLNIAWDYLLLHCHRDPVTECTGLEINAFVEEVFEPVSAKIRMDSDWGGSERNFGWFRLWLDHRRKTVPTIPQDHAYYALSFATIVKYLPAVLLWNTGLPYRNGKVAFARYSPEFLWLACGGSLRKIPGHPPYSKRMAKEFLNLELELPTEKADVYVYCFLRSLEVSHDLAIALQRFFRRPADPTLLRGWKDRLNPIAQKLRSATYDWGMGEGEELLGYLAHCVRDGFGFAANVRSVESLEREAAAFYARIDARRARAEARRAERESKRRGSDNDAFSWTPMAKVKAWEVEQPNHQRVRRWKICELTHQTHLLNESAVMRHCVSSYFVKCRGGHASIWSLRELIDNNWVSRVTVEVVPQQRRIVQIRGRHNAEPEEVQMERVLAWAKREKLDVSDYLL